MESIEEEKVCENIIRLSESPRKSTIKYTKYDAKCNMVYKIEDKEIKKIQINDKYFFRLIETPQEVLVDIRKFYKGYPTKQGVRFTLNTLKKLINVIKDDLK